MNSDELYNSICETLDEFEVEWERDGVYANLDAHLGKKRDLTELFRKHPNWNEAAHAIILTAKESRCVDLYDIQNYRNILLELLNPESYSNLSRNVYFGHFNNQTVNGALAEQVNTLELPGVRSQAGQKTSRLVRKLWKALGCEMNAEFEAAFAKFADVINPYEIERPFIISLNPSDYLTMSYGNSWASCHIINPEKSRGGDGYSGCSKLGTLSYMNDGCTAIVYTVDKLPDDLSDLATTPKLTRQCFMFDLLRPALMQSRLYPYGHNHDSFDLYRNIVQEAFAKMLDVPNLWKTTSGGSEYFYQNNSAHYADYIYTSQYGIKVSYIESKESGPSCPVGSQPYCLRCGDDADCAEELYCEDHAEGETYCCEHCGNSIRGEDIRWVGDYVYCEDCVRYCDHCGDYHVEGYIRYIDEYDRDVCDDCLDRRYSRCEHCNAYVYTYNDNYTEIDGDVYCDECRDEYLVCCEGCGDLTHPDNINGFDDKLFCTDCYRIATEEKAQEENEQEDAA